MMPLEFFRVMEIVFSAVAGGAACYAAIRADLARLHERASIALDAAQRAHERIDTLNRQLIRHRD